MQVSNSSIEEGTMDSRQKNHYLNPRRPSSMELLFYLMHLPQSQSKSGTFSRLTFFLS